MPGPDRVGEATDRLRTAESVLKRLGYSRVPAVNRNPAVEPSFWVQEAGVPRRTFPVYMPPSGRVTVEEGIDRWVAALGQARVRPSRAIFVVPTDAIAEEAWARISRESGATIDHEVSILVVPPSERAEETPHFHQRLAEPREILRIATGIVVGLFRRAQGSEGPGQVDFEELLSLLRERFGIDVHRSFGVQSDEDALFILYQLALRDSYVPGDPGSNLHLLVLKPTGPAARLPWFAA
ncbi:MAG: hypothetical protein ABSB97_08130 [Thermoplasmata archaeon]|jgi:hypothetical protein